VTLLFGSNLLPAGSRADPRQGAEPGAEEADIPISAETLKRADDLARGASDVFDRFAKDAAVDPAIRVERHLDSLPPARGDIESASDWLARIDRDYRAVVERLSEPTVPNPVADAAQRQRAEREAWLNGQPGSKTGGHSVLPGRSEESRPIGDLSGPVSPPETPAVAGDLPQVAGGTRQGDDELGARVLDWLNRAYRNYEKEIVERLAVPAEQTVTVSGSAPAPADPSVIRIVEGGDMQRDAAEAGQLEEIRRAEDMRKIAEKRREAQPAPGPEADRVGDLRRQEVARKAEAERRAADLMAEAEATRARQKAESEAARRAEEARVRADAEAAGEARKAEAERRVAEFRHVAEASPIGELESKEGVLPVVVDRPEAVVGSPAPAAPAQVRTGIGNELSKVVKKTMTRLERPRSARIARSVRFSASMRPVSRPWGADATAPRPRSRPIR
jgi:hypothetical protein